MDYNNNNQLTKGFHLELVNERGESTIVCDDEEFITDIRYRIYNYCTHKMSECNKKMEEL